MKSLKQQPNGELEIVETSDSTLALLTEEATALPAVLYRHMFVCVSLMLDSVVSCYLLSTHKISSLRLR